MVAFILILTLIICNGLVFSPEGKFNENYLDKKNTTAVNGIFVILVVFSHYTQYADLSGVMDMPYIALTKHLGQMVVATFWFYSGYGMMESIRRTDGGYTNKLLTKFWQLLVRFDVAVLIFWVLNALLGTLYPLRDLLLALTGWRSVGNSNWYIFAILVEYLLMYLAFKAGYAMSKEKGRRIGLALMTALTIVLIVVLMKADRPSYTYNTIIILPFGACYSEFRKPIEKVVMRSDISYLLIMAGELGLYTFSLIRRGYCGMKSYVPWAIAFVCLIILLTMKVQVYNPVLEWFGKHIFSIYILQRLPMMLLAYFGCISRHKYISLIIVFAITMPIALMFEKFTDRIISFLCACKQPDK